MRLLSARNGILSVAILSLLIIAVVICTKSSGLLYDEAYFVPNIARLSQLGLSRSFLLQITGSPGPTYAVIHSAFNSITNGHILNIRLVNYFLLLLLLLFIYLNAKLLGAKDALVTAANFIMVPIVWVVCGLALTEVPTMLCAMVSMFFLLLCVERNYSQTIQILLAALAGLFQSFAIMGRSFFMMSVFAIVFCLLLSVVINRRFKDQVQQQAIYQKKTLVLIGTFVISSLILPLKVFSIWHSLAPPTETQIVGANNFSLVPWHALLSFAYCGFVTIILAPGWFFVNRQVLIASVVCSVLFLVFNLITGYFEFAPLLTAAGKILNARHFIIYQRLIPALIFLVSIQFVITSAIRLWAYRNSPVMLYIGITILLIAFSAIKVKVQFSSRYVAQVVPYMILLFIPFDKSNSQKVLRVSVGAVLGFVSLYFYYHG